MLERLFLNNPSGGGGWIGLLTGGDTAGKSVAIDDSGNIYICGYTNQGGSYGSLIAKYNNLGVIQWQRKLGSTGQNDFGQGVAVDTSGNVYVCGNSRFNGSSNHFILAKYNAFGIIQWQRGITTSSPSDAFNAIVDASGNLYVSGTAAKDSSDSNILIAKYNSSGTFQSSVQLGSSTTNTTERGGGIALDSSGVVYIAGNSRPTSPLRNRFFVSKLDAAFTQSQWQQAFINGNSNGDFASDVVVNSGGDVYATGQIVIGTDQIFVCKFNSSGTVQWQRSLGGASNNGGGNGITLDNVSGDIYVCAYNNAAGSYDFIIAKYNSSGVLQWQRRLGGIGFDVCQSIQLDNLGNFYICGYVWNGTSNSLLVAKLPGDGSGTGTYSVGGVSLTYAVSSLTDAVTSFTTENPGIFGGASLSLQTPTVTDAATTLTSSVIQI